MRERFIFYLLLVFLTIIMACNSSKLRPQEYVRWVENEDHGIRISKRISDIKYTLQYEPLPYVVAIDEKQQVLSKKLLEEGIKRKEGMQYYLFRIESKGSEKDILKIGLANNSKACYGDLVQYMSFDMQYDIQLIEGNDSLPCKLYQLERSYEITPYVYILLAFDDPNNNSSETEKTAFDKILIYKDKVFSSGTVRMQIKAKDIEKIPSIIVKEI